MSLFPLKKVLLALSLCCQATWLQAGHFDARSFSLEYSDDWTVLNIGSSLISLQQKFVAKIFKVTVREKALKAEGMILELIHARQENPCTLLHVYDLLSERYNKRGGCCGQLVSFGPIRLDERPGWKATYLVACRGTERMNQYVTYFVIPVQGHIVEATCIYDKGNYEGGWRMRELIEKIKIIEGR